ncbi:hypothetical protein Cch01nite_40320 [Cellulomonas chitinilytica]|uniref:Uncharacterized protein n=1 Tax=Cellulomonas chitinilytica TaxID=398759 RepID=A0A919P7A4_9CELL|nr:hypothetical protein [Cellulomonas chitinilytica]GIG23308.1 hypothetical protein Cch01nite_40320 [Cellulomonas chitinilytica]
MSNPAGIVPAPEPVDAGAVRGPSAVLEVCMRCIGVLAVVSLALGLVIGLALKGLPGAGAGVFFAWWSWLVASVLVMLVGWPAGLLTSHLLRRQAREWVHVTVFAVVGGVICPPLFWLFMLTVDGPDPVLIAAGGVAVGAVGAGGGRWWTGAARRGRLAHPVEAAQPGVER